MNRNNATSDKIRVRPRSASGSLGKGAGSALVRVASAFALLHCAAVSGWAEGSLPGAATPRPVDAPAQFEFDGFFPIDPIVSDPGRSLGDPEFDQREYRLTWHDGASNLWVADIDPATGAIIPPDGLGTLVDTGLAPNRDTLNGPEWVFGSGAPQIIYTKLTEDDEFTLGMAFEIGDGVWQPTELLQGNNRWMPIGTPPSNISASRIAYLTESDIGVTLRAWRYLTVPDSELVMQDATVRGFRFVDGDAGMVCTMDVDGNQQVALQDQDGLEPPVPITFDAGHKAVPFVWWAPEFEQLVLVVSIDTRALGFYREIDGQWTQYYMMKFPTHLPELQFPRPFVFEGRSYVAVIAAEELSTGPGGGWIGLPTGETEVWITGIDPERKFQRRVSRAEIATRVDLEAFTLESEPVIYYTEVANDTGNLLLRRASTGLVDYPPP